MSMSTLGQQLAAINAAPGKTAIGSTLSTSRRHDDAIGRGLSHSVQVGHSVNNKTTLYKPSIIYEDARKASDVPLTTIRENCVASLRRLEDLDPEFGIFVNSLCKPSMQERGLLTSSENDHIDKSIEDLMFRLALRMSPSSSNSGTLSESLHVVEFLLRKFDLHLRPKTASTTLLVMLPHHEQPFFLRLLQLMDLANMPEWSFLRPFAMPGARLGRSILAQHASKDIAFLRSIGRLSQQNAKLPCSERSLSFTAAVLVEALTLQTQRKGTMEEGTCQALLPFVVAACRNHKNKKNFTTTSGGSSNKNYDWQHWGYILSSTMIETSVLEAEPRKVLVNSILEGLVQQKKRLMTSKHGGNAIASAMSLDIENLLSNGMTVALTILLQDLDSLPSTVLNQKRATIQVGNKLEIRCSSTNIVTFYGFDMKKDTLSILLALEGDDSARLDANSCIVADCLGHLYAKEGITEVKHWVAAILTLGWKILCSAGVKNKKKENCRRILKLLLSLMERHPHLLQLWEESEMQWAESYATFLIANLPTSFLAEHYGNIDGHPFFFSFAKELLLSVRNLSLRAFERGTAHALLAHTKEDRKAVVEWLRQLELYPKEQSGCLEAKGDNFSVIVEEDVENLPPRVALEHSDVQVRLKAVSALSREADSDGIDVCRTLLHCIVTEESTSVAVAAACALQNALASEAAMDSCELARGSIAAYHKWFSAFNISESERLDLLRYLCHFASMSNKGLVTESSDESRTLMVMLLEILGALMTSTDRSVAAAAVNAVLVSRNEVLNSSSEAERLVYAKGLLVSNNDIVQGFQRSFETPHNPLELSTRRKLINVLLDAFGSLPRDFPKQCCFEGIKYCSWVYETFSGSLNDTEASSCVSSLLFLSEVAVLDQEESRKVVLRLCAGGYLNFETIAVPFVQAVCSKLGERTQTVPLAILMEWALSVEDLDQLRNLLIVCRIFAADNPNGCLYAIVPALTLGAAANEEIRGLALDLLLFFGGRISECFGNEEWSFLSAFGKYFQDIKKNSVSNGLSLLSQSFCSVLKETQNPDLMRFYILKLTLCFAASATPASPVESTGFENSWLAVGETIGGYRAAITLLETTEMAGEECFPLLSRWRLLGKPLIDAFLESNLEDLPSDAKEMLVQCVRLLKGVIVAGTSNGATASSRTIITSGPTAHGGRSRSYSFGKGDSVSSLRPYPKDMQNAIHRILTAKVGNVVILELKEMLCDHVLSSRTWNEEIFRYFDRSTREQIALSLIQAASRPDVKNAEAIFYSMPLRADETIELLSCKAFDDGGLAQITIAAEYVRTNAFSLVEGEGYNLLMGAMVEQLSLLRKENDNDSQDFARHALTDTMREITVALAEKLNGQVTSLEPHGRFGLWMDDLIVEITGAGTSSYRSAKAAMATLVAACECFPKVVVPKVSAFISGVAADTFLGDLGLALAWFNVAVPVFFRHACQSGMSVIALFKSLIVASKGREEESQKVLFRGFVRALELVPSNLTAYSPIGLFAVSLLAQDAFDTSIDLYQVKLLHELIGDILSGVNADHRLAAASTMQIYARDVLCAALKAEKPARSKELPSLNYFSTFGLKSAGATELDRMSAFCEALSVAAFDVLSLSELRHLAHHRPDTYGKSLLFLWQECLMMQIESQRAQTRSLLIATSNVLGQSMELLQNCLPPHIYLAFVTNLLKEGGTKIQCRAVQTITERSQSLLPQSSESDLLLEMVPTLLEIIQSGDASDPDTEMLQHLIFVAIDSIGRKCSVSGETSSSGKSYVRLYASAASIAADCIWTTGISQSTESFGELAVNSRQLISSASICASTAVKVSGSKSIPAIPKLVPALLLVLNLVVKSVPVAEQKTLTETDWNEAVLFQLSVLRALTTIVATLPTLLKQHLTTLLETLLLIPTQFQTIDDTRLEHGYEKLAGIISSKVPFRHLVPAASIVVSALPDDITIPTVSLLSILKDCLKETTSAEISSQAKPILNVAFSAFERKHAESDVVWTSANNLVIGLAMKQSEIQFRKMFQRIWDWREEDKTRNYVFWQLASSLSKSLKAIFLPCLGLAYPDAVGELEAAASALCSDEVKKRGDGKKRQRVSTRSDLPGEIEMVSLKAMLQCLETSLHADAQSGGAWIRDAEAQRFEGLLGPLGKLLGCRLPSDGSATSFQAIVLGSLHGSGSVVGCIVGLASAAGDEQLWKPLNHVVLQACGHGSRKDVRQAGVSCLLSLIQSIGEEYMVLIPECLPVLAELLEDSDEDIARLARDCIAQSEELLGESLQDSLL